MDESPGIDSGRKACQFHQTVIPLAACWRWLLMPTIEGARKAALRVPRRMQVVPVPEMGQR